MSMTNATVQTAQDLIEQLTQAGYIPGSPPHIRPDTLAIDAGIVRRSRCHVCRARGRRCRFLHRGASYVVVAVCPQCDSAEEV